MELLKVDNNTQRLTITPEALNITEFKLLWKRDRDRDKKLALKELSYVYFMADYKSVYNGYNEEDKEREIINDIFTDRSGKKIKWKPDSKVKDVIAKYDKLQLTASMKFLHAARKAAQALIKYFESVDFTEKDSRGMPLYKVNDVVRALGDSSKVVDAIDKWEKKVQKEQFEDNKITGGGALGIMEDPE